MIIRYRNRALTGFALGLLMFGLLALLIILRKSGIPDLIAVLGGILFGISGVILYLRGCMALAEAKGHASSSVAAAIIVSTFCLPGLFLLLPIALALALEDRTKHPSREARHRRDRRAYADDSAHQPQNDAGASPPRTRSRGRRYGSHLERVIRYRKNAILGIYFGLPGIALGVFLVIFRVGIFLDHANEVVLGMFIFLGGYSAVLSGCWWWLKAKAQNEALVFIGLMPLGVLFIPFVRLIFLAAPGLLSVGMVMMPLILIVVVLVLPDQSGTAKRKPWWETSRAHQTHLEATGRSPDAARPSPSFEPAATSDDTSDNSTT